MQYKKIVETWFHEYVTGTSDSNCFRHEFDVGVDTVTDVDKVCIYGLPIQWLAFLVDGEVNLANNLPRLSADLRRRLGVCIVRDPVFLFITRDEKALFQAVLESQPARRVLPYDSSTLSYSFLTTLEPRKAHMSDIKDALMMAGISRVNTLCYGQKVSLDTYRWLDDLVVEGSGVSVEVDFGGFVNLQGVDGMVSFVGVAGTLREEEGRYQVWPMCRELLSEGGNGRNFGSQVVAAGDGGC
jgi:hypothetical protein